jgi:hypothetical protein
MVIVIFTIVKAGYRAELLLQGFKRDGMAGGAPNGAFINRKIGIVEILLGRSLFLFLDRNLDTSQSSIILPALTAPAGVDYRKPSLAGRYLQVSYDTRKHY